MTKMFLPIFGAAAFAAMPALAQDSPQELQDAFVAGVTAEDADAVSALYTEDAYSYGPDGSFQQGPEAIAASWAAFFDGFDGFSISLEQQGDMHEGKVAGAWGLWTMSATPVDGGDKVVWRGRYADISKKTKNGWRYIVDHASPLVTEEASEAEE